MRKLVQTVIGGALGLACAGSAVAQDTPPDVRDLVGARGAGGETALRARGYVDVGGRTGDDRKWTYWWNAQRGACLSVATMDGRYDSIVSTPAADCGQRDARAAGQDRYAPPPYRPDRGAYREHIALICYGEGEKLTNQYRSGYQWDADKRRYVPQSGYELATKDYDTSVTVQIDGDTGRIRPARNMIPPIHSSSDSGWYDIRDLSISRDTIRGQFKLNGANQPKLTIDRRSGHITLDGLTKFRGTCDAIDADRKF